MAVATSASSPSSSSGSTRRPARRSSVECYFDPFDRAGIDAVRAWRDLLPSAPREATLTCDTVTAGEPPFLPARLHGRPVVIVGFVWVGDMAEARAYLARFRRIGTPQGEEIAEMRYVDLQSSGDERHHHGLRRYSAGHYLTEFSDTAIDAFLARGIGQGRSDPDWATMPGGGFQAYGGAIAEVGDDDSAFSHRDTLVEFFAGSSWADPAEDDARMAGARRWAASMEAFSSGTYVNVISDPGEEGVSRAYGSTQLDRLAAAETHLGPRQRLPPEPEHQAGAGRRLARGDRVSSSGPRRAARCRRGPSRTRFAATPRMTRRGRRRPPTARP